MKILYISQYYHPEVGATSNRALANVASLHNRGHQVTVLTEMPNHPLGVIFPLYRKRLLASEIINGVPVHHLYVCVASRKNFLNRILMYASFAFSTIIWIILHPFIYDVIYITSPPLFVAWVGIFVKLSHPKTKLVFEVRDLWPDSAIELNELTNSLLVRLSLKLEMSIYNKADIVIAVSQYIRDKIISKGISSNKVFVFYNGTDICVASGLSNPQTIKSDSIFHILYAGNLGLAQGIEVIINAAEILRSDPVKFTILGNGPCRNELVEYARTKNLSNLEFHDIVSKDEMPKYYAEADAGVVPLKDLPVFSGALPSKLFDFMAFAIPVLVGIKGEAVQLIEKSGAGLLFPPGDANRLAEQIKLLIKNPQLCESLGRNGQSYVTNNFSRAIIADKLVDFLEARFFMNQ